MVAARQTLAFFLAAVGFALSATPVRAAWHVAQSGHFLVYSDEGADEAAALATRLEQLDKAVRVVLGLAEEQPSRSARTTIFIVPSVNDVRRITGASDTEIYRSPSVAGPYSFFPRRSVNDQTRRTASPLMMLQHQYVHQLLRSGWGGIRAPAWLSEGLAEFFATTAVRPDGGVILGGLPEHRWDGVDKANGFPIEQLVRAGPDASDQEQVDDFCGRSWLLIDYLTFDPARSKQLSAYIAAVKAGRSADEAASILGINASTDRKLNGYGVRPTWPSAALGPERVPIGNISTRELTAAEVAAMPTMLASGGGVEGPRPSPGPCACRPRAR